MSQDLYYFKLWTMKLFLLWANNSFLFPFFCNVQFYLSFCEFNFGCRCSNSLLYACIHLIREHIVMCLIMSLTSLIHSNLTGCRYLNLIGINYPSFNLLCTDVPGWQDCKAFHCFWDHYNVRIKEGLLLPVQGKLRLSAATCWCYFLIIL